MAALVSLLLALLAVALWVGRFPNSLLKEHGNNFLIIVRRPDFPASVMLFLFPHSHLSLRMPLDYLFNIVFSSFRSTLEF